MQSTLTKLIVNIYNKYFKFTNICNNFNLKTYNQYNQNTNTMNFTTISNAKKLTGLSYLGGVNISQKIVKSQKVDNIMTYCLYLSPAKTSGYQVCPFSTPECRKGCLATSGRAKVELLSGISSIKDCRINKTKLFFEHQDFFMQWLIAEISTYQRKAFKKNMGFAVRLNGTSDIEFENILVNGKKVDIPSFKVKVLFSSSINISLHPETQQTPIPLATTAACDVIPPFEVRITSE